MKFKVRLRLPSLISFFILLMLCLNLTNLISSEQAGSTSFPASFSHPIIFSSSVSPTKVQPGDLMLVSAVVFDFFGVEKIEAKFFHEQGFDIVNLSRVIGSNHLGVWQGQWIVHDTKIKEYTTTVTAFSKSGLSSSIDLTWWDPTTWWDSSWLYRVPINVSNTGGGLTDYQIKIELNSSNVGANFDWSEDNDTVRFTYYNATTETETEIPFWIETWDSSGQEATIWVNVSYLPGSSNTIVYTYYGNPSASNASSGDNTFVFFDDFNDNDISDWQDLGSMGGSGTWGASDGKMTFDLSLWDGMTMSSTSLGDYIQVYESKQTSSITLNLHAICARVQAGTNGRDLYMAGRWGTTAYTYRRVNNVWSAISNVASVANDVGTTYMQKLQIAGYTLKYKIWEKGTAEPDWMITGTDTNNNFATGSVGICMYNGAGTIDNLRVRKYASTEPTYSMGSEEIAMPTKPILTSPENNGFTNDITPRFQWTVGENAENHRIRVDNETNLMDDDERINVSLSYSATYYDTLDNENLSEEGRWYWNVSANNSNGENASDLYSFILDTTGPDAPSLSSPADNNSTDGSLVTFTWYAANDSTINTTQVSNIDYYQLQVDNDSDFSSASNYYTSDNSTLSLTETVTGQLFWRVRAWDQAGNNGNWSDNRTLTVFDFDIKVDDEDSAELTILKGQSRSLTLSVTKTYSGSDCEPVNLSYEWQDPGPSGIGVTFGSSGEQSITVNASNETTVTFEVTNDATTGTFTCILKGNWSGFYRNATVELTSTGMLFSMDSFPQEFNLIRDDTASSTISIEFDMGLLEDVSLAGTWSGDTPGGVSTSLSLSSGTPSFESTLTFTTSKSAEAGSFVYKVQGTGSGVTKKEYFHLHIYTNLTLTLNTDKSSYEKGQEIQISGTAKDPDGTSVGSGTATIQLSATNWSHSFTTSITSGTYSTSYYIAFDKPGGDWTVSVTATDSHGHETSSSVSTSISVGAPEIYEHYFIDVLSPTAGQLFKRGETVTFTISLADEDDEKIQGADVKACFSSGEEIVLSEKSLGVYSTSYELGYDFQIGSLSLYVEGKKYEDGKLKAGFNYIDFEVQSVEPILELIEPKAGALIEVGETIKIRIKALYPDGTPLEESVITAVGPDGEELLFIRSKEPGIYVASYTPSADDFGDWAIQIKLEDAYGNSVVLEGVNVEIVHSRVMSILLRYWWATLAGVIAIAALVSYLVHRKLRKIKLFNLKNEILELGKLKKRNAILYFSEGEITRETYDKLSQDYESKIARLSKKQRLLEKKIEKKKKNKKTKGGENEFKKKS